MKVKLLFLITILLPGFWVSSQEREEELGELLLHQLNELRNEEGLHDLTRNELLDAAAFDQVKYIVEVGKVVHEQESSKKRTVRDRVDYYEGLHANLGENASKISFGTKEQVEQNGPRVTIESDLQLVKAVLTSWLNEEGESQLNTLDSDFYEVGIGVLVENEDEVTVVAVFGSQQYEIPDGLNVSLKNHGIKPYQPSVCDPFLKNYPTLPQLLSDVVQVKGSEVSLRYHSLGYFQSIVSNASDGIALDVIDKSQYSCEMGNRLFPGTIADGYLMRPIKKGYMNTRNRLDSIGELDLPMGMLPPFYQKETSEINMVIIKEGTHCVTIPFNQLELENRKSIELPFLVAGESDTNVFVWNDSIVLQYNLLGDWTTQKEKDEEVLKSLHFQKSEERLTIQTSPIHAREIEQNEDFQGIKKEVMWAALEEYIQGTYYQLDLAELNQLEKVDFLKESIKTDDSLRLFLESLNALIVEKNAIGTLDVSNLQTSQLIELYKLFLRNYKIQPALFVQAKLLEKVRLGTLSAEQLPQADPSQKENTLAVINNQIILEHLLGAEDFGGNPMYLALLELHLINKNEVEVSFNYHIAKLQHWAKYPSTISNFPSWLKEFKKLQTSSIPSDKYARAMVNYYLIAVDYYFDTEQFDQRKRAFSELKKWQLKANLNEVETIDLANALCFQDQFVQAIELVKPFIGSESPSKEALLFFIQTARYDAVQFNSESYMSAMEKASRLYPESFCKLFTTQNMGIQGLKNAKVKQLYCAVCNN